MCTLCVASTLHIHHKVYLFPCHHSCTTAHPRSDCPILLIATALVAPTTLQIVSYTIMQFSTSLVLFIAIVTGALHAVTVSATPYGSTVTSGSRRPISSDNPYHLERRGRGKGRGKDTEIPTSAVLSKPLSKGSVDLLRKTDRAGRAFRDAWQKTLQQSATPDARRYYIRNGPADGPQASKLEWAIWDHIRVGESF
ncbi:hypothetical protein BC835DRAFT_862265 [Cytidiella melzeri]|nr:hypothetical protein BC835DRAFT_862265 [Cytidiella melzeri]